MFTLNIILLVYDWWAFWCQSVDIEICNTKLFSLKSSDLVQYIIVLLFFQEKKFKGSSDSKVIKCCFFSSDDYERLSVLSGCPG